jgi:deoxyadenosine/deoxycytidine kinase
MFILEGIIGAGKSTFLKILQHYNQNIEISFEPLHHWFEQEDTQSLLTQFYRDPQRWAYTMETCTMISRVKEHIQSQHTSPYPFSLTERSLYSGHYCIVDHRRGLSI